MWPSDLTLAVTLTLNFQGEIWIIIYLNQNWSDCHETISKHIDLNSRPQIWPMGLTLAMTLIFEFWRSYVILTISLNKSNPIQILIALVWEWALHTVYYNISSDLQRVHTPTLEIQSSYWPTHQSTARQFSVGTAGPTKIDASVGSPSSPDSFTLPSVFGRCEW